MTTDIIDDRLLGALHLRAMNLAAFAHDPRAEHVAFQAGTLAALMDGHFDGDATVGSILEKGDHGIGTIAHLDGEMIIVDGRAYVASADGVVRAVPDDTTTPFAVVCRFSVLVHSPLDRELPLRALREVLDSMLSAPTSVLAVRLDGEFRDIRLRSVHAQSRPYPPLTEVTKHQTEWSLPAASGSVIGFRFPDLLAGVEVPGYHLHFLSDDREHGGHVLDLTMLRGSMQVDGGNELHVELPAHIGLGTPGVADRAAIRSAEGG
jgi:acetolactate decarboxylase